MITEAVTANCIKVFEAAKKMGNKPFTGDELAKSMGYEGDRPQIKILSHLTKLVNIGVFTKETKIDKENLTPSGKAKQVSYYVMTPDGAKAQLTDKATVAAEPKADKKA